MSAFKVEIGNSVTELAAAISQNPRAIQAQNSFSPDFMAAYFSQAYTKVWRPS
jgi:hypothetical protein